MDSDWVSTTEATRLWNEIVWRDGNPPFSSRVSEWSMRKACRDGTLAAIGIEVLNLPGRYYISRASLCHRLWLAGQRMCRRAELAAGIDQERVYAVIGEVGEQQHGNGLAMDDLWRALMAAEFKAKGDIADM